MHVSGLFIYPVKSCRGIALTTTSLDTLGLTGDRRFLIVDADGKFITQRTHLALIPITTALDSTHLTLTHPKLPALRVPLTASTNASTNTTPPALISVTVWGTTGLQAEDCGPAANAWISEALGQHARLVRIGPAFHRPVGDLGDATGFADGYPLLVISEASLANLNDRLIERGDEPVPMDRFRPNLVISGSDAFAEDTWPRLRVGEATFRSAGPCARCTVTTTDQLTGERTPEPLRTLATYRRDPLKKSNVNFGQNLINETKSATLHLGDTVTPLA
ncbi:molybdenum cofactor biosysynthesis protein [Nibricoccus aquaticus]|uniref:Molybdenum cofactor biosysynthesis protein n=1 Tax=Nibricoccus aquaticus TaxID=2576891 RepID=A0A290Q1Z0_9BACT|nr:MOSC N-terminal beta barrel domain-containing protein [Nibricoccus aquaticus]ATC62514.1 molybdenum cofactor biosysynthesis protein [Nibricoccus aquaticus]